MNAAWSSMIVVLSTLGVIAIGCGGGAEPPPTTPDKGSGTPSYMVQSSPTSQQQDTVQNQPTARPGTYATPPNPNNARIELDRAQAQVEASLGDCTTACRALASMESAAHHLCSLDGNDSDDCNAARARVSAARDRVQRACGPCR
jgi:hypothetical protein